MDSMRDLIGKQTGLYQQGGAIPAIPQAWEKWGFNQKWDF